LNILIKSKMKKESENADSLISPDGKITVRIGSRIKILERTGYTSEELIYPFEGIVTQLTEEWDNGERGSPLGNGAFEDWGPNMITIGEHIFYPDKNFSNIEIITL